MTIKLVTMNFITSQALLKFKVLLKDSGKAIQPNPYMYEFKVVYTVNGEEQEDIIMGGANFIQERK